MKPGKLRDRITYFEKTLIKDDFGGTVEEWKEFASIRATIIPLRGKDLVESQAMFAQSQFRIFHRFLKGISSVMQIEYNGNRFELTAPPIDVRNLHREMEIYAKRIEGGA